jgi:organic radical activating enzyme
MLKLFSKERNHINNKFFSINVTNVCNLSCGGCNQLCGLYPKEKNWFIKLEQLELAISCLRDYIKKNWNRKEYPNKNKFCGIYGGEPTIHPEFDKIIKILNKNEDIPFCIYTNGRTFKHHMEFIDLSFEYGKEIMAQTMNLNLPKTSKYEVLHQFHTHEKNIAYRIDFKTKENTRKFVPSLCAPCDVQSESMTKSEYVYQAQKVCYQWNNCEHVIYNGKAYVCHLAAAMDHMFYDGQNGWDIKINSSPFDKTKKQINDQLLNFCYRCGYNLHKGMKGFEESTNSNQYTLDDTLVTITNYTKDINKSSNIKCLNVHQKIHNKH